MTFNTVWLHGLESAPGGHRVAHLETLGNCYAPAMDYRREGAFADLVDEIARLPELPDYIIGSSMGGYYAFHVGRILSIPTILFNPALPYRTEDLPEAESVRVHDVEHTIYCGADDDVIDPNDTFEWLRENGVKCRKVLVDGVGHRTDDKLFYEVVKKAYLAR